MEDIEKYYFKLVCVNENNPLEYEVLEDVNLSTIDEVHKYVIEHFNKRTLPEMTKWILLPMKKINFAIK